jgi:hypothetical protein
VSAVVEAIRVSMPAAELGVIVAVAFLAGVVAGAVIRRR